MDVFVEFLYTVLFQIWSIAVNGLCWHRQTDLFLLELQHFALSPLFSLDLQLFLLKPQKVFSFDTLKETKMQWTNLFSFIVLQELPESFSEIFPL